ncbi:Phosphotransferase enzyme family protein [Oscillibacter sp. PC13]|uniref:phosphotransferase family protein n=1 Tax=Oscillibacter sp. PC13 TaxID=1855299 RepID=UPI0008E4A7D7|nr:aminoglycoside phosphotransferase family protein [Oscillibacter sp. PC13]SFP36871.1 Phosphotransferase enzyme family protein [Oscillibacter sp. PC13]
MFEQYAKLVPNAVPKPISYDAENYIMVRKAVPESWAMWKSRLLNGEMNYRVAEKAITALCTVHNETAHSAEIARRFHNQQFFYDLRIEPYIQHVLKKYPQFAKKGAAVMTFLTTERSVLIHGDYSPKNILVKDDGICILDMEVACYGNPCFDVAFFSNHFLLKAVKHPEWSHGYLELLSYMMRLYFDRVTCVEPTLLERQAIQTLGFLLLARVDGKSPVEYLTAAQDQNLVREAASEILCQDFSTYQQAISLLVRKIDDKEPSL